tara:strand:- start:46 stop:588 length:543 start_codon:yes stop_codon:yes gene_type:complete
MTRTLAALVLATTLVLPSAALAKKGDKPAYNPDDQEHLQITEDVRVVFHATADVWKKGTPQSLWYVHKLVTTGYPNLGVSADQLDFKLVAHDQPVYWFFTDEAWAKAKGKDGAAPQDHNPHKELIQQLLDAGVDIEVCAVTLKNKGWTREMLLPGIKVTPAGVPRVIDLQLQGFAYLKLQ